MTIITTSLLLGKYSIQHRQAIETIYSSAYRTRRLSFSSQDIR